MIANARKRLLTAQQAKALGSRTIRNHSSLERGIKKSQNDPREYAAFTLDNGLKALLISDPATPEAAAAMDVRVGYFQDPKNMQGLAHFCEHLLFLGTKKYPDEGNYKTFLSQNGGYSNASTGSEHTNYFFSVQKEKLEGALDRFSCFFTSPLFNEDATTRELNAVHSEFVRNTQDDGRRMLQVFKRSLNQESPFSNFSTGNMETLGKHDINLVRGEVMSLYKQYYVPDRMQLTVCGQESLEQLRELVIEKFSEVTTPTVPLSSITKDLETAKVFQAPHFSSNIAQHIVPIKDFRRLSIAWQLPTQYQNYESKPVYIISQLLEHQSKKSLYSHLKSLGWINGIGASIHTSATQFAIFQVDVALTESGLDHIYEIIEQVYHTIDLVKHAFKNDSEEGRRFFDENSLVLEKCFNWLEKSSPSDYCSALAKRMHFYPSSDYLYAPYKLTRYDRNLISQVADCLTPDNMRVVVTAKAFADKANLVEPIYGTQYYENTIPSEWMNKFAHVQDRNPEIQLPPVNSFIAKNFDIKNVSDDAPEHPIQIHLEEAASATALANTGDSSTASSVPAQQRHHVVWHKEKTEFKVPMGHIQSLIRLSADQIGHIRGELLLQFYISMVHETLAHVNYQANQADLSYGISIDNNGLEVFLGGFTDQLHVFGEQVYKALMNPEITKKEFDRLKSNLIRHYENQQKSQASTQAIYYSRYITTKEFRHHARYLKIAKEIEFEEVLQFAKTVFKHAQVETFVNGNITPEQTKQICTKINDIVQHASLSDEELFHAHCLQLPTNKEVILELKNSNEVDTNSAALMHYQVGPRTMQDKCKIELLSQMIKSPFFLELRTKQQLGYSLHTSSAVFPDHIAFDFVVQSAKFSALEVYERMDTFVHQFEDTLTKLSPSQFDEYKESLAKIKLKPPTMLAHETSFYWNEIYHQRRQYDRIEKEVRQVDAITHTDMVEFYHRHFLSQSQNTKKLTVLCYGNQHQPSLSLQQQARNKLVLAHSNLMAFRDSLPTFPKIHPEHVSEKI